jgi:hypothetical protein
MSARKVIRRAIRDEQGASAVEFALLVPVMLLIFFTILDVAAYGFLINRAEKSTQMGARWAVVTDSVDSAMATYEFVGQTVGGVTYTQGDRIQASALGVETCTSSGCTCTPACPWTPAFQAATFTKIGDRVRRIYPQVTDANLVVEYRGSGLGYAGDPAGMDIAPLVTVKLKNMTYSPMALSVLKVAVPLPSFTYSLTIEDASGSASF